MKSVFRLGIGVTLVLSSTFPIGGISPALSDTQAQPTSVGRKPLALAGSHLVSVDAPKNHIKIRNGNEMLDVVVSPTSVTRRQDNFLPISDLKVGDVVRFISVTPKHDYVGYGGPFAVTGLNPLRLENGSGRGGIAIVEAPFILVPNDDLNSKSGKRIGTVRVEAELAGTPDNLDTRKLMDAPNSTRAIKVTVTVTQPKGLLFTRVNHNLTGLVVSQSISDGEVKFRPDGTAELVSLFQNFDRKKR